MAHHLVIVESPAKAKTIQKYLGAEFKILASYGHVRDLLPKEGAVNPAKHFAMHYELIEKNTKHVNDIVNAMKKADALYLATDPDREGEAISWHVYEILQERNVLKKKPVHRVVFHEITRSAIQAALSHPRDISMDLVNAQQARRALDYLVGFNLSPVLWRKVRHGLSAGRVQSPALRMIVEREEEIERFVSQEYWDLAADTEAAQCVFSAKLTVYEGEKLEQFSITNEEQAEKVKKTVLTAAKGKLTVAKVEKKQRKRHPAAPFITSTLQQEAARHLGMSVQRTMRIAQQLYEGVELDSGLVGLISYMRTDSVNLAKEAIDEIRVLIAERYGKDQLPDEVRLYKTKAKNAQEAHEAIRPTSVQRTPEQVKKFLSAEQYKLYELIWKRTVACQMISATIDTVAVDLAAGSKHVLRATGSVITDPGFMRVYQEGTDDKPEELSDEHLIPPLQEGDEVVLKELHCHQHFTEPPPRYSEATLIKTLEEYGIGRPSTYASIVYTLQSREYVILENKRFRPTDMGRIVNRFLTQHFTRYVDYGFTAQLEDELDDISRGEKEWVPLLEHFWDPFKNQVDEVLETVKRSDVRQEILDEACPQCAKPLVVRLGKRDRFIGCTGYPECTYTRALHEEKGEQEQQPSVPAIDKQCPDCGGALQIKQGRYGKFIGCGNYPRCKHIESLQKPADTGVECPECQQGKIVKRQSRRGKVFYSCSRYPDCKYALWNEPVAQACPKCAWPVMTLKVTKKRGKELVCPRVTCKHTQPAE
ncbi:MAG: DNA topoisomerase I [Gammaproteobacteria bacterium RIFCSPHIGHO2_12_FULL_41_20]|nr:MAG: DNA topoisomerase I [Gammaproteobacteria bacterium RIFCSPHIGHO2_12_FULL_41_20]